MACILEEMTLSHGETAPEGDLEKVLLAAFFLGVRWTLLPREAVFHCEDVPLSAVIQRQAWLTPHACTRAQTHDDYS